MAKFVVREINAKSVINRVHGMPFDWSINPYRGCRHACVYCYARPTHEFIGLDSGAEFQEVIFAKVNAPTVVRQELARPSWRRELVVVGTATDPYQQAESRYKITRGILEAFRDWSSPVSIVTKSPMILRDLDLLRAINQVAEVTVCMTVTTMDERIWRLVEPTTSKPKKRMETIAKLRESGIHAGVLMSPILPGITDDLEHMEAVCAASAKHGASFLSSSVLRLGPGISDYYLPFVEREFPHLKFLYREMYRGNYAPGYYVDTIQRRANDLRLKYRLTAERKTARSTSTARRGHRQLDLFAAVA
jgi:DNA repair photolyase